ncbi:hypothetical protein ACTVJH_00720 [Desulfoplanes sp. PS50]|jgi:hypothetical protein
MSLWPVRPVLGGLKLPRGPRTIKPLLNTGKMFRAMSGNGSMNDAWLGRTVKPSKTGQTSHYIPGGWMKQNCLSGHEVAIMFFALPGRPLCCAGQTRDLGSLDKLVNWQYCQKVGVTKPGEGYFFAPLVGEKCKYSVEEV